MWGEPWEYHSALLIQCRAVAGEAVPVAPTAALRRLGGLHDATTTPESAMMAVAMSMTAVYRTSADSFYTASVYPYDK